MVETWKGSHLCGKGPSTGGGAAFQEYCLLRNDWEQCWSLLRDPSLTPLSTPVTSFSYFTFLIWRTLCLDILFLKVIPPLLCTFHYESLVFYCPISQQECGVPFCYTTTGFFLSWLIVFCPTSHDSWPLCVTGLGSGGPDRWEKLTLGGIWECFWRKF